MPNSTSKSSKKTKKCIYCKKTDKGIFKGVEHMIPQSFGTFGSETPILDCVCDECNAYFGKKLDQGLARDTLEGVTRYKKGILSRERRFPKNLHFFLEKIDDNGEYGGAILDGYDPLTGKSLPVASQFWIKNIKKNEWERYRINQIKNIKITNEVYGSTAPGNREMRIIAPSEEDHDNVIAELKKYNIPYRKKELLSSPPFLKNDDHEGNVDVRVIIQGTIDKTKKRALVKILFNFAAYFIGETEILKPKWDKARKFIRYDRKTLLGKLSQEPFWTSQEKSNLRYADDSYNLRIENKNGNVVGVIQLYNLFTYEFILVENYSIPTEKEIAYRFTPNKKPHRGIKMIKPDTPLG